MLSIDSKYLTSANDYEVIIWDVGSGKSIFSVLYDKIYDSDEYRDRRNIFSPKPPKLIFSLDEMHIAFDGYNVDNSYVILQNIAPNSIPKRYEGYLMVYSDKGNYLIISKRVINIRTREELVKCKHGGGVSINRICRNKASSL